jgi:xanthine/uracil permease
MSDFFTREPVPRWRLVAYGFLAAAGVAVLGYYEHDSRMYIAAAACGLVVGGFGFLLSWARANVRPIPGTNGQPAQFPAWVRWLFITGLIASLALKIWDIYQRK